MAKKIGVRILVDLSVEDKSYKPNQLVAFEGTLAKSLEKAGKVDSSQGGIDYCLEQGIKPVEHGAPESEPAPEGPQV